MIDRIDALRTAFSEARTAQPFRLEAIVVLPDHLHCLWRLPEGDADNAGRWRRIKTGFARRIPPHEYLSPAHLARSERGIWQRRYWEHLIRDDEDYRRHVEYIHYNPVKHGHVAEPRLWPHSSFARWVARGGYPMDWGSANA